MSNVMKYACSLSLCLALTGLLLAGCDAANSDPDEEGVETNFRANAPLLAETSNATEFALYEGLPHPSFERQVFEDEKQRQDTIEINGFMFYRDPFDDLPAEGIAKLKGVLANKGSFKQWRGAKSCGGFHPDYLAEWRNGESTYRFLICFGCSEIKFHSGNKSLRCDIRKNAVNELESLLKTHRKNRPLSQRS